MTTDRAVIEARGLVKSYGWLPVLRGIDLSIRHGEFIALLGANGSGKSTLLRVIAGLLRADEGSLIIGGWVMPNEAARVRAQIGLVSHKPLLYESLTARENLRFFARMYNLQRPDMRIDALLARVGLDGRDDEPVRGFSRGMQQRLSIARAILHAPSIILLDEPYTGLDAAAAQTLDSLLGELHREGHTLMLVTHQLEQASLLADRVLMLARGKLCVDLDPKRSDPADVRDAYDAAIAGRPVEPPARELPDIAVTAPDGARS